MSIVDTVSTSARGIVARVRRDAIVYLVCAVCALTAFVLSTWASVLALVPLVGAVYALLILAGGFLLIVAVALLWLRHVKSRASAVNAQPAQAMQRQVQFAQLAMIVEAVLLGYSMARRRR